MIVVVKHLAMFTNQSNGEDYVMPVVRVFHVDNPEVLSPYADLFDERALDMTSYIGNESPLVMRPNERLDIVVHEEMKRREKLRPVCVTAAEMEGGYPFVIRYHGPEGKCFMSAVVSHSHPLVEKLCSLMTPEGYCDLAQECTKGLVWYQPITTDILEVMVDATLLRMSEESLRTKLSDILLDDANFTDTTVVFLTDLKL